MNKFKINKTSGVLTLNGDRYIPHQLHQLPHNFQEIDTRDIVKMKGYVYIHECNFKNVKLTIDCLSSNRDLGYKIAR